MTSALPSLVSDAADFECEYKINDKTQILHQTTTDDDIVTSSEIGKNDKGTSIEDIQNREKGQILKIYFQSELKKILPESYKRDQHQTLNNDKVLTINATNSVVNINCAVPGIVYYGFMFKIFRNTFKLLQISKFNIFRLK